MDFKSIISHCKEYGFIFQSSEIYDGLSAVYDYGPNGVELKNNIKNYWWKSMVQMHENIVGIDSAFLNCSVGVYAERRDGAGDDGEQNGGCERSRVAGNCIFHHLCLWFDVVLFP